MFTKSTLALTALSLLSQSQARPLRRDAVAKRAADFGSCSTPSIIFAQGLDNRKETAFEPKDLQSFNHGSAQNIDIITQFMCDTLTNTCNANQDAKDLCTQAKTAADGQTAKTGAQADAFNAVFGETTDFAAVQAIDDQGNPVGAAASGGAAGAGAGAANAGASGASNATAGADNAGAGASDAGASAASNSTGSAAAGAASSNSSAAAGSAAAGGADFGSCSTPSIVFAAGLDGRKETAFEPKDLQSFNHGSAQNIDIITQFMCDQLTNSCKANQAAKDLCTQATTAADGQTAKTGAQADAFNAVFGETTNFASVQALDDQGNAVGAAAGGASSAAAGSNNAAAGSANAAGQNAAAVQVRGVRLVPRYE